MSDTGPTYAEMASAQLRLADLEKDHRNVEARMKAATALALLDIADAIRESGFGFDDDPHGEEVATVTPLHPVTHLTDDAGY